MLKKHLECFREYTKTIDIYRGEAIIGGKKSMGAAKKKALSGQVGEYVAWYDGIRDGKFDKIINGAAQNEGLLNKGGSDE